MDAPESTTKKAKVDDPLTKSDFLKDAWLHVELPSDVHDQYHQYVATERYIPPPSLRFWFSGPDPSQSLPLVLKYDALKRQGLIPDGLSYSEWEKLW